MSTDKTKIKNSSQGLQFYFDSITFADGKRLSLLPGDTLVIVGPNNSGKSATLNALYWFALGGHQSAQLGRVRAVVRDVSCKRGGTPEELTEWLASLSRAEFDNAGPLNPKYRFLGGEIYQSHALEIWAREDLPLGDLGNLAIYFCRTEQRIFDSNSPNAISRYDRPSHPLHALYDDVDLEEWVSEAFYDAFAQDLVVNWRAGSQLTIHVGKRPLRTPEFDRISNEYVDQVTQLPMLQEQGDGMRSFATLLFASRLVEPPVLLVDEPEAFLHPPQARRIGEVLKLRIDTPSQQLFVATHSVDVLRGLLVSGTKSTKIVRLTRERGNQARLLSVEHLETLWSDPILTFSNAFDGLFHEATILCEGDADCRFYETLIRAVDEADGKSRLDLHFAYTAGKDRLPVVQRALAALGVRVIVIADFDVIRKDDPLKTLLLDRLSIWEEVLPKIKTVREAVEKRLPTLPRTMLRDVILEVIDESDSTSLTSDEREKIKGYLKGASLWTLAKDQGRALVSGEPARLLKEALSVLRRADVFVVPDGQLESFERTIGGHGPAWVARAMARDIKNDPDFETARAFARQISAQLRASRE